MSTQVVWTNVPGGRMPPSTAGREARHYFSDSLLAGTMQWKLWGAQPPRLQFGARRAGYLRHGMTLNRGSFSSARASREGATRCARGGRAPHLLLLQSGLAGFLALACLVPDAFAGTVITNHLPANTAIINIDSLSDGAAGFNGDQSLWYHPFSDGGALLTYTIEPGTYGFRIVNPSDAMALFPSLTSGQVAQLFTSWTYNTPWITDYLVFDSAAATNFAIPQLFDGAFSNTNGTSWSAYGSPDDAYNAAISQRFYNLLRTSESGGRSSTTFFTQYTFTSMTTLIFAIPDNLLADNFGGVSVLVTPAPVVAAPTLAILRGGSGTVTLQWATNASGFNLQQSVNLHSTAWTNVATAPAVLSGKFSVTVPVDASERFFRLSMP